MAPDEMTTRTLAKKTKMVTQKENLSVRTEEDSVARLLIPAQTSSQKSTIPALADVQAKELDVEADTGNQASRYHQVAT